MPINPRVIDAVAREDYTLLITFENSEQRIFDMKPYLDKGVFKEMSDLSYFMRVQVVGGAVEWPNEQDLSHDTLYLSGRLVADEVI